MALIVAQTVLLAVDSAPNVFEDPRSNRWGTSRIDFALLGLFVVYTYVRIHRLYRTFKEADDPFRIEIIARIIVSGFIVNPKEYSTMDSGEDVKATFVRKAHDIFSPQSRPSVRKASRTIDAKTTSMLRSFTERQSERELPGHTRQQQRVRLAHRAFLRHSFNRLDFIAVVSFWIAFTLAYTGIESKKHLCVFRMLSCLRILRLLGLTNGTSVSAIFSGLYLR